MYITIYYYIEYCIYVYIVYTGDSLIENIFIHNFRVLYNKIFNKKMIFFKYLTF